MTELREKMTREMELRDFSPNTVDAYLAAVKEPADLLQEVSGRDPPGKSRGLSSVFEEI